MRTKLIPPSSPITANRVPPDARTLREFETVLPGSANARRALTRAEGVSSDRRFLRASKPLYSTPSTNPPADLPSQPAALNSARSQ